MTTLSNELLSVFTGEFDPTQIRAQELRAIFQRLSEITDIEIRQGAEAAGQARRALLAEVIGVLNAHELAALLTIQLARQVKGGIAAVLAANISNNTGLDVPISLTELGA